MFKGTIRLSLARAQAYPNIRAHIKSRYMPLPLRATPAQNCRFLPSKALIPEIPMPNNKSRC